MAKTQNATNSVGSVSDAIHFFKIGEHSLALKAFISLAVQRPSIKHCYSVYIYLCAQKAGLESDFHGILQATEVNDFSSWLLVNNSQLELTTESTEEALDSPAPTTDRTGDNLSYRALFDKDFYLRTYPDLVALDIDPFEHYASWGWREGRRPNSWFDPGYYLDHYSDVRALGVEPLLHYYEHGRAEGRLTKSIEVPRLSEESKSKLQLVSHDKIEDRFYQYRTTDHVGQNAIKLVAFFLPQFHPFPENDQWWGKGFTEWSNVTKALPNFKGHYQPHLPIHSGFYDLRVPEVLLDQARLAQNYGIYGFNFYYYWFDGKILMNKPFEILLNNPNIDIKFCLTWANENWTRRWDGADNDILIAQKHSDEDSSRLFLHLVEYFKDPRYITVEGKPMFIIYRAEIIPRIGETLELWRKLAIESGLSGLHIVCAQTFGLKDPRKYGFDAAMEFPPHTVKSNTYKNIQLTNQKFEGKIYNYAEVVENSVCSEPADYCLYRTAMLSWDNTARKQDTSHIFANFSLISYKQWLSHLAVEAFYSENRLEGAEFVFVNAWNEWAEGTHLEPDRKYGYGYLDSTYQVVSMFPSHYEALLKRAPCKAAPIAVIVHLHYHETWPQLKRSLANLSSLAYDLYVSLTEFSAPVVDDILAFSPNAIIRIVENRGRDILPFVRFCRDIFPLEYELVLKIHGKKSSYRPDGDKIRDELLNGLLGSTALIEAIIGRFEASPNKPGIYCPPNFLIPHTVKNMTYNSAMVDFLAEQMSFTFSYDRFPAGSMYWFKPKALEGIISIRDNWFTPEEGLSDGTAAHAVERVILTLAISNGFTSMSL